MKKEIISANSFEDYHTVIEKIGMQIQDMLDEMELKLDHCIGIGAAIPGTIDKKNGFVVYSNNIGWNDVPFAKEANLDMSAFKWMAPCVLVDGGP